MNRRKFIAASAGTAAAFAAKPDFSFGQKSTSRLLFGFDYYPDQTPEPLWEGDASSMERMGVTNVRVAEFAWSLLEPVEGRYDLAWLRRVITTLDRHNIGVILGTPSAAPPNWLTQKYPEVLLVNERGMTLSPGARRFTCPTNPTYRLLSKAVVHAMATAFHSTPGVLGWQIDNELSLGESARCYCRFCRKGFQAWLQHKYGTLDAMNQAWGAVVWSNTYTAFGQVPLPMASGAPPNPGLALDYDRYQSDANISFLEEQSTHLRSACPTHFITTNNVAGLIDTIDLRKLSRSLDFLCADNYPSFFAIYLGGQDSGVSLPAASVASIVAFTHDFARSAKNGKPFMVMEEQVGKTGQTVIAPQPEPGQLRLWSFQAIAHGAMGINYFRWDTPTFGPEQFWQGLLKYDRTPSVGSDEIGRTIAELKSLGADGLHAPYVADVALWMESDTDWALSLQSGQPKWKYSGEILAWHGILSALHMGVALVDLSQGLEGYKVLCAPLPYMVSAQQIQSIRQFVQSGGTFVSGPRLHVKDPRNQIAARPLAPFRDLLGADLLDDEPIYSETQGIQFHGSLGSQTADCHLWFDVLEPQGAEVLATYTSGRSAGKAAITTHAFGKGKAVYLGAHLDPADLARVLATLMSADGLLSQIQAPPCVEITSRRSGNRTWNYVLNHTAAKQSVQMAGHFKDLLSQARYNDAMDVEPYGVLVLEQS